MSRAILRSNWTWIVALSLIALAELAHRTPPIQRDAFFFDFSNAYSASRAFVLGHNPYDLRQIHEAWDSSRHGPYLGTDEHDLQSAHTMWAAVHPPSTLLLLAPLAAMNAVPAHLIWVSFSAILLILAFFALFDLGGISDLPHRLLLVACGAALAPVQSAIECGQPALPAAAMIILAVWAYARDRDLLAGALLGLATALKMQLGGPFVLYYLFIRQWRVGTLASLIVVLATTAAIARLHAFGHGMWWAQWNHNLAVSLQPGQVNDPRPMGPWRNDMVNLQTLVDVLITEPIAIDFCVLLVFVPLLVGFLTHLRRGRSAGCDLLALSMVALISMLPLYRRLYDGVLLLMLLTWAIAKLKNREQSPAAIVLGLMSLLLIPIDLVPFVLRRTHAMDGLVRTLWWQGIIVPHHAWAILALSVGTLYVFSRRSIPIITLRQPLPPLRLVSPPPDLTPPIPRPRAA
jgi:hypothetical protein